MNSTKRRHSLPVDGIKRGRATVRGHAVKTCIVQLKCETKMSTKEIAEVIGCSERWVRKVWNTAVEEATQAQTDPEIRIELKTWMIEQLKLVIMKSQQRIEENPAYGALVLKAVLDLHAMLGLDHDQHSESRDTLEEIAAKVDLRSPLVMAKLRGINL